MTPKDIIYSIKGWLGDYSIYVLIGSIALLLLLTFTFVVFIYRNKKSKTQLKKNLNNTQENLKTDEQNVINQSLQNLKDNFDKLHEKITVNNTNNENLKTDVNNITKTLSSIESYNKTTDNHLTNQVTKLNSEFSKFSGESQTWTKNYDGEIRRVTEKIETLQRTLTNSEQTSNNIATEMQNLNKIFYNTYSRGLMGEESLKFILNNIFGRNSKYVHFQTKLPNGKIPDVYLTFSEERFPIDSKFPFSDYDRLMKIDPKKNVKEHLNLKKKLNVCLKKYINDIAEKYINIENNASYAIMFLPNQPLFELLHDDKDFSQFLNFTYQKNVWVTGPTLLPVFLKTLLTIFNRITISKNVGEIIKEIESLEEEFKRYHKRWEDFDKRWDTLEKTKHDISVTNKKINKKFENILIAENKEFINEVTNKKNLLDQKTLPDKNLLDQKTLPDKNILDKKIE